MGVGMRSKVTGRGLTLTVIGLLVLLTGSSRGETKPGSPCCVEDWEDVMSEVLEGFKTHAANLKAAPFKVILDTWLEKVRQSSPAEMDGTCGGLLQFKCVGTKDSKCECNNDAPFTFVLNANKTACVGEKAGSVCVGGPRSTKCNDGLTCDATNASPYTGVCKAGETEGTGDGGKESSAPRGAYAYSESHALWAFVVGGLALLLT